MHPLPRPMRPGRERVSMRIHWRKSDSPCCSAALCSSHAGATRIDRKHPVYDFSYRGKPIEQLNTKTWRKALEWAGIEDFRWHDLRHTWTSWHVQAEMSLHVLQEIGGWESVEMVTRFAHLSCDYLVEYLNRMPRSSKIVNESDGVANQLRAAE